MRTAFLSLLFASYSSLSAEEVAIIGRGKVVGFIGNGPVPGFSSDPGQEDRVYLQYRIDSEAFDADPVDEDNGVYPQAITSLILHVWDWDANIFQSKFKLAITENGLENSVIRIRPNNNNDPPDVFYEVDVPSVEGILMDGWAPSKLNLLLHESEIAIADFTSDALILDPENLIPNLPDPSDFSTNSLTILFYQQPTIRAVVIELDMLFYRPVIL